MNERPTGENYFASPSITEISRDISELNSQISTIYALRDSLPGRFLPDEKFAETRRLHGVKDQRTVDLILADRELPVSSLKIVVKKYEREKIHPFSMNQVSIYVPSIKLSGSDYCIKTELSDLRRPQVIEDSLQAESFLGEVTKAKDSAVNFTHRTASELAKIRDLKINIARGTIDSKYSEEELDELSCQLIIDRLLILNSTGELPFNSTLSFVLFQSPEGIPLGVNTRLTFRDKVYNFPISGGGLAEIVEEYGGYDKLITVNA